MSDPERCQPEDVSKIGQYYLTDANGKETIWWWMSGGMWRSTIDNTFGVDWGMAREGYRILGPVPSHADVVQARELIAQDGKEIERLETELTAANAEIERLKRPDLVTVRREDLRELMGFSERLNGETRQLIDVGIAIMEDAAR